ncbi:MAG: C39 family peptidase, partial [Eubacterium sp.]|nr:C39 family peptidase [Eubacterium sp.]
YPEYKDYAPELDLTEEASGDEVPLLIQWDKRWGYIEFGNGWIGCSACGAVCMSMAALYLTGNTKYDPVYISKYAIDNHYYIGGSGITSGFMTNAPADFGMYGASLAMSESNMIAALENGKVIICSVAPGDFTYRGHYIVISSYKDGKFKVNDPNSYKNSERGWTYQELSGQITQMWSMEKAN